MPIGGRRAEMGRWVSRGDGELRLLADAVDGSDLDGSMVSSGAGSAGRTAAGLWRSGPANAAALLSMAARFLALWGWHGRGGFAWLGIERQPFCLNLG